MTSLSIGRSDRKNIRRIEKFERSEEKDLDEKQEKIIHNLELVANNITVADASANVKHKGGRSKSNVKYSGLCEFQCF